MNIPDHGRDFGEIAEADEFGHQADAGSAGGGQGACAGPSCADHHADGGEFVFGLDDGVGSFLGLWIAAGLGGVGDHRFGEAGGGSNWVPGCKGKASEDGAGSAGGVAVEQDGSFVEAGHAADAIGLVVGQCLLGPVVGCGHHRPVELDRFGFAVKIPVEGIFDLGHFDVEQEGGHADVDHIGDVALQVVGHIGGFDQGFDRHGVVLDIFAVIGDWKAVVVEDNSAGHDAFHIFGHGGAVHADHNFDAFSAGEEAIFAEADVVPGGQPLDIAGEEVFAGHGDAHFVEGADQQVVAGLAAGAIGGRHVEIEVVVDPLADLLGLGFLYCHTHCFSSLIRDMADKKVDRFIRSQTRSQTQSQTRS